MKRFKDFATKREIDCLNGKREVKWTMGDIFKMLDYLAERIEKIEKERSVKK